MPEIPLFNLQYYPSHLSPLTHRSGAFTDGITVIQQPQ